MSEQIRLEDLRPEAGSTSKAKRVGRGRASGHGKTSCRGNNGEGQRSGRSSKRGFEGGQMPGYRQMPKLKGFENFNSVNYAQINVGDLEKLGLEEVDIAVLKASRKVRPATEGLRVLGNGELTATAKEKIEKAGGKAELV
jgi:large subunit ribosomal protein L15